MPTTLMSLNQTVIQPPLATPTGITHRVKLEAAELDWEISTGVTVRGYGFNGQVPGPTIEARAGDTLFVDFTNHLPEPTSIHWHGLRVPAEMDGSPPDMPGMHGSSTAVPPGGTFQYRFMVPDAGTFWYHPHVNETRQLERGLYGAIVVRDDHQPTVDQERVLIFDDLKLNRTGEVARAGRVRERIRGREGSTLLVNGTQDPVITMAAGQTERWRLVNAANARYLRLSIGGRPFTVLGTSGGLAAAPTTVTEILLPPGDRVDLAVGPFHRGDTLAVDALPYDRGAGHPDTARFAVVTVGAPAATRAHIPARLRDITPITPADTPPHRRVRIGDRFSLRHGVQGTINDEPHHHDDPVQVGQLQVWELINNTTMDHPFHLHGFFFQIVETTSAATPLAWRDTVNVPANGIVRIAWIPDDRPGNWMYHCHILEHHAAGMMAHLTVTR